VAGGRLLEPSPHRYGKRHTSQWQGLSRLAGSDYSACIQFRLAHEPALTAADLYPFFAGSAAEFEELLAAGARTGLWERRGERIVRAGWLAEKRSSIVAQVRAFHKQNPSQIGPVSAELLAELPEDLHAALLRELESDGVRAEGPHLCHSSHRAGLTSTQEQLATAWRKLFDQSPFAGPTRPELLAGSPEARPTLEFLLKSGEFTELKDGVLLRTADFERAVHMIVTTLKDGGELTVAALRDALGATRKYALPILVRCDRLGYTRRVGDARVLGPRASELLKAKNP
jgi:selenocysteine-specific elongation factor